MKSRTPRMFNIHAAKTHFSKLIARVERGEEVIIAKAGKPVAKIGPVDSPPRKRATFGDMKNQIVFIADDFDAPLPDFDDPLYTRATPVVKPAAEQS